MYTSAELEKRYSDIIRFFPDKESFTKGLSPFHRLNRELVKVLKSVFENNIDEKKISFYLKYAWLYVYHVAAAQDYDKVRGLECYYYIRDLSGDKDELALIQALADSIIQCYWDLELESYCTDLESIEIESYQKFFVPFKDIPMIFLSFHKDGQVAPKLLRDIRIYALLGHKALDIIDKVDYENKQLKDRIIELESKKTLDEEISILQDRLTRVIAENTDLNKRLETARKIYIALTNDNEGLEHKISDIYQNLLNKAQLYINDEEDEKDINILIIRDLLHYILPPEYTEQIKKIKKGSRRASIIKADKVDIENASIGSVNQTQVDGDLVNIKKEYGKEK